MILRYTILPLLIFISISSVSGQSNSEWKGIGLTVSGMNNFGGVEAFYQYVNCDKQDVVLIKFINHNNYSVEIEWNDALFTKELKWVSNRKKDFRKTIILEINETKAGNCSEGGSTQLVVPVHDFIKKPDNFKLFGVKSFKVKSIIK